MFFKAILWAILITPGKLFLKYLSSYFSNPYTPEFETFEKRPLLPNSCVPDGRDLRFASTGSNFNPRNTQCIPVVKILAFLALQQNWTFFKGLNFKTHKWSTCVPPRPLPATLRQRWDGRGRSGQCLRNLHRIQQPEHIRRSCPQRAVR